MKILMPRKTCNSSRRLPILMALLAVLSAAMLAGNAWRTQSAIRSEQNLQRLIKGGHVTDFSNGYHAGYADGRAGRRPPSWSNGYYAGYDDGRAGRLPPPWIQERKKWVSDNKFATLPK